MSDVVGSVERGCGRRVQGGVYAETSTSKNGKPVEAFLLCPPVVIDPAAMGITPVGVKIIQQAGVNNVWDWIGSVHYPNVTDFIEEVRRFGLSRRLPKTLDFAKLDVQTGLYLLHSAAWINEPLPYHVDRIGGEKLGYAWEWCPAGRHEKDHSEMCCGLFWENVKDGKEVAGRIVDRNMPSFTYTAARPPQRATKASTLAIFAVFPIHRLVVIRADDGSHERTADKVQASDLPFEIVEE